MPKGSSWEPVPAYSHLCQLFREANNSRDCSWNVITTVWESRGMKAYGGNGANQLIIRVDHNGIKEDSKTFERAVNTISNRVYKRQFTGQPYDFFASSIVVSCWNKKLIGEQFIGQVQLGIMDIFLGKDHMLPMQWFPVVDPKSDLPSEPLGYLKLNCIINNLDESGAVQERAPDAVADWELTLHEILQIPRMNMRKVACHQYNLKFMTFQGFDLGTGEQRTADPIFRVLTPCGVIQTDPFPNSLKPQWNTMLQIPFYEPTFCDLIHCEVWDGNRQKLSALIFSWKDIIVNAEEYQEPRWIDMYERKIGAREGLLNAEIPLAGQTVGAALEQNAGFSQSKGFFEERSVYCGRVLLAIEVEERSFKKEPSPANIALKPKDCNDMWSDAKQKMFFRFQCFYGQDFSVDQWKSRVQVEFQVGRKRVLTKPVQYDTDNGLYNFFEAVELDVELPMDDRRDNPLGWGQPQKASGMWDPECFVSRMPDIWVKVYKVSMVGLVMSDAEMIGFWRGDVRTCLGGGDPEMWSENVYVGTDDDNQTNKQFKGIQPIIIAMGDEAPAPTKRAPWGREDEEATVEILNPYQGYRYVELKSDISCSLGPADPAGFLGFSAKLWLPTRFKCANGPPKGPPVLSPWTAWNKHPIMRPWDDRLKWTRFFNIKAHIYQASSLGAKNDTGVANAWAQLHFLHSPPVKTHTAYLTNNPTFDTTLMLNDQELFLLPDSFQVGAEEFIPDAEDSSDVRKNWKMLSLAPRFEVRVYEEINGEQVLLGRNYIEPSEVLPRKTNPKLIELFRGNPEIEEGNLLVSFQLIETNEKIAKEPPVPLVPDKSKVNMDDDETWCSKAPIRKVDMFESKIQIQVLGLRDLSSPHPFGLPVANPQIEICCDDPKTAQMTKSASKPSGTNANFMECVEIDVRMPIEKKYAPFLDFYVYDHSTLGLPFEINASRPPIVAYGSMATEDFYPSDEDDGSDAEGGDGEVDENDEAAKKKAKEREMKKKFVAMIKELKRDGHVSPKEIQMLNTLYMKKDEAVIRAFEQYIDAPDSMRFIERVESFFGERAGKGHDDEEKKEAAKQKKEEEKQRKAAAKKLAKQQPAAITDGTDDAESKRPVSKDSARPVSGASGAGATAPSTGGGEGDAPDGEGADAPGQPPEALDEGDAPDGDEEEEGDEQDGDADDVSDIVEGHAIEGEDDMLPDQQEKVDTPDGKPNAEWLLLRSHPLYNCPLEKSTIREYGKKGAWEPRFEDAFDELVLYRGQIHNFKQIEHESVGILKCKVKLFRKEDEAVAESRGDDPRFLDMAELKAGKEVPYEVPDVNENFQARDIEVRVYLLKAFQMTPSQVIDGIAKSDNFIRISLGGEEWDWRNYYEPIVALNPHFYKCAKISAKLPGPSQMHIALADEQSNFVTQLAPGLLEDYVEIGETVVDLEDRWFCEEWAVKTVNKPRETRDLYNSGKPGISVGKMMVIVDAVLRVDADDKKAKDVDIAGRQMPLEMRLIVWNLRNCAPKDGYTSDVKVFAELLGWGRMKETDCDMGVKVSRNAMFNFRLKFKGIKFPSPDPTIPAKDYILNLQVWGSRLLGNDTLIAEGLLPLQPIFQDCMQRNLGKPSPDDMEIVSLEANKAADVQADEEGTKYPFKWYSLCHPGGPGCKTNKDFKQPGYDFVKNRQAEIQITVQVMPRAKARALPASPGFKPGPAKLFDPNRPPQPTNPIFDPEGCKAYIVYVCKEAINRKKPCCCCLSCCIILILLLVVYVYLLQAGIAPAIPIIPA